MSLLNYLQFQEIDSTLDDMSKENMLQDEINLDEQLDEGSLEIFWDKVVDDIHKDPEWFSFAEE